METAKDVACTAAHLVPRGIEPKLLEAVQHLCPRLTAHSICGAISPSFCPVLTAHSICGAIASLLLMRLPVAAGACSCTPVRAGSRDTVTRTSGASVLLARRRVFKWLSNAERRILMRHLQLPQALPRC